MLCTSARREAEVIKKLAEVIADFHTWHGDLSKMDFIDQSLLQSQTTIEKPERDERGQDKRIVFV